MTIDETSKGHISNKTNFVSEGAAQRTKLDLPNAMRREEAERSHRKMIIIMNLCTL
jgi:hypothetical protein